MNYFADTLWVILKQKECLRLKVFRHVDRVIYSRLWSCLVAIGDGLLEAFSL